MPPYMAGGPAAPPQTSYYAPPGAGYPNCERGVEKDNIVTIFNASGRFHGVTDPTTVGRHHAAKQGGNLI